MTYAESHKHTSKIESPVYISQVGSIVVGTVRSKFYKQLFLELKIIMKLITASFLILLSSSAIAAEYVTSNCDWRPKAPVTLNELQKNKDPVFSSPSNPSDDEFKVVVKGRTYFYSLPDKSCKSEVFIVNGDRVSAVDYYPIRTGVFTDFARVHYYSKSMNKNISGWIEMNSLMRLTAGEQ